MDVILCFFHWIPKGAMRSWRSLPRCSDRRAVRGGLRSSPCPSVFSSPPRRRGVPRRWWLVLIFVFVFIARVFCFCFVHSRADAITRWHRLTPSRDDTAWRHYEMTPLQHPRTITICSAWPQTAVSCCWTRMQRARQLGFPCRTSLMLSLSLLSFWLLLSYSTPFNSSF